MLYVFKLANAMSGHRFTDDVAITFALTKKGAIKKFQKYYKYYDNEMNDLVSKITLRGLLSGVCILTDY